VTKKFNVFIFSMMVLTGFALQGCGGVTVSNEPASEEVRTDPSSQATQASSSAPVKNIGARVSESGVFKTLPLYTDAKSPDNHYTPSGWMGDFGDVKVNDKHMDKPHGGSTSVQIVYSNKATQGARWAGIYWQNPPNNWGTRPGGYDLTGAKKVTFWARGEKGGERIEEFKIGGITGEYAVVLTTDWQQFTIDLEGKDLSSISGGFCWATNLDVNPDGATFYLDDIRYE
jgi:hypothetical protein